MPSKEHTDLMSELRSTRSVRGSMLTFANSVHQRLKVALEANSGHGDYAALRELCDDLSPTHRDGIADSLIHGTSIAAEDKDADPTAPTPASNPGSLGGDVYGSKGPEDTDTQRPGGTGGNRETISQSEEDARRRQAFGAEARNREEREKNEREQGDGRASPETQTGMDSDHGAHRDMEHDKRGEFNAGEQANHDREFPDASTRTGDAGEQHSGLAFGQGAQQQDRPAGARNRDGETGRGERI